MIVSLDIYGRELKVCKDTVITYTLEDNRKIAILLKQGEYDAAMCKSLKNIVVGQDTLINNLKHTLYTLTNQANVYKQSIADLGWHSVGNRASHHDCHAGDCADGGPARY